MGLKVFVGFEGAVTRNDVGSLLFESFGNRGYLPSQECPSGPLSARERARMQVEAVGFFDKTQTDLLLQAQPVDPTFRELAHFCRDGEIDLAIVSDGPDYFVREILNANDTTGLTVFANSAEFVPSSDEHRFRMELTFPFTDAECRSCTCCKRNILLTTTADEDIVVYIGGGNSDACPVRYADIIFAKQQLQTFCQEENITCYPYNTFRDVTERLRQLRSNGTRLRKRKSAVLNRQEVFLCE